LLKKIFLGIEKYEQTLLLTSKMQTEMNMRILIADSRESTGYLPHSDLVKLNFGLI